jgi:hypothetical protein
MYINLQKSKQQSSVISYKNEICARLGYYAALSDNSEITQTLMNVLNILNIIIFDVT